MKKEHGTQEREKGAEKIIQREQGAENLKERGAWG